MGILVQRDWSGEAMKVQQLDVELLKMGPFRFIYNERNNALYVQALQRSDGTWKSIVKLDRSGNLDVTTDGSRGDAVLEEFGER